MVKRIDNGIYLINGKQIVENGKDAAAKVKKMTGADDAIVSGAYKGTISYGILNAHHTGGGEVKRGDALAVRFDALASHDITYVGIVQTARASGLAEFPVPYVLTNCHNSLCAVGGTINEDDHVFGLSAAKKYGGIFVPPHIAVIHQYMREMMSGCGKMILGSDSHTRYGALGTMAVGEGGPELVKQILKKTYDVTYPDTVAVVLTGKPRRGVGPQDVALAVIGEVFASGFVKNKIMEFVGEGISNLSVEFRNGIDVMTTETTCLTSIWATDKKVREYYEIMGRPQDYRELAPEGVAYYDAAITVDLDKIEPMIAMPFHPSNVYRISDVQKNPLDILREVEDKAKDQLENPSLKFSLTDKVTEGSLYVDQGVIAGCAGGIYDNIVEAAAILKGKSTGNGDFSLSVYPASQPVYAKLIEDGAIGTLISAGAVVKTAFCGPCFGAGDVPANGAFSVRHTTRNFPSREGSKPGQGQIASVALMDARSIAATAANGGKLTGAMDLEYDNRVATYRFDASIYANRVYTGKGKQDSELKFGPNIADWPAQIPLTKNVILKLASAIFDPVTTTDELIPSGETSSYRSNPGKLAEFTLSRKDPGYVGRSKAVLADETERKHGKALSAEAAKAYAAFGADASDTLYASAIFARKPGDGSAREQAASCQRVLGGLANIAAEYATKRYRSNLINWGMLPLLSDSDDWKEGDYVFIPNAAARVKNGEQNFPAKRLRDGKLLDIVLKMDALTADERDIVLSGCLINYYNKDR